MLFTPSSSGPLALLGMTSAMPVADSAPAKTVTDYAIFPSGEKPDLATLNWTVGIPFASTTHAKLPTNISVVRRPSPRRSPPARRSGSAVPGTAARRARPAGRSARSATPTPGRAPTGRPGAASPPCTRTTRAPSASRARATPPPSPGAPASPPSWARWPSTSAAPSASRSRAARPSTKASAA